MYKIDVFRKANSTVTAQRFDIMVDERIADKILSNQHKSIELEDNSQRKLHIQCGMFRSNSIYFTPQKDTPLSFTCGSELDQKESIIKIVGITLSIIIILTALTTSFKIATTPTQFLIVIIVLLIFYLIAIKEIVFYKPIIELKQNRSYSSKDEESSKSSAKTKSTSKSNAKSTKSTSKTVAKKSSK